MVYGYERLKLDVSRLTERMLEQILEDLDDEYGDPNGGDTKPTTSMKQAAHALVEAIVEDYIVWAHDKVEEHEVDVREWVKTNRPDWLEEAKSD
jgi:Mg2+/Co2+ transporter CorC